MQSGNSQVIYWLRSVCLLIILMVTIGGITRLTQSGLSIVEWQPLMGAIPPTNASEWNEVFQKYQATPQYRLLNQGMPLEQFKVIFFWEYLHRLLGRFIGIAFFFPWLYFVVTRKVSGKLARSLGWAFVLGALQGAMGWFMVMSGLVDRPHVSHYRLAAHLGLALVILGYLYWILLGLTKPIESTSRKVGWGIFSMICIQIIYGAFMAGTHAGYGFNTFPKMNDEWIPTGLFRSEPLWLNFFDNTVMIQFVHRILGIAIFITALWLWKKYRTKSTAVLAGTMTLQFILGVSTLLLIVPITLAAAHQLAACFVLLASINVIYRSGK